MKPRNKLEGNGRWEASRMMLTEHVEALDRHYDSMDLISRPELTEERIQELLGLLQHSMVGKQQVTIDVFNERGIRQLVGAVTFMNARLKRVRVELACGFEWVEFVDVLEVSRDVAGHRA
ncbi:MAG: YolD-like family protein [Gorillibacterium sp.]|nr:YolD-like family protein [Gorillibacterium sp.]